MRRAVIAACVTLLLAGQAAGWPADLAVKRTGDGVDLRVYLGADGAAICIAPQGGATLDSRAGVRVRAMSRRDGDPPRLLADVSPQGEAADARRPLRVYLEAEEIVGVLRLRVDLGVCRAQSCHPAAFQLVLPRPREKTSVAAACF